MATFLTNLQCYKLKAVILFHALLLVLRLVCIITFWRWRLNPGYGSIPYDLHTQSLREQWACKGNDKNLLGHSQDHSYWFYTYVLWQWLQLLIIWYYQCLKETFQHWWQSCLPKVYCLHTYLTYSMEKSPWEANWFSASQKIPCIVWNLKVHYRICKCLPPVPIKVCCYFTIMLGHILLTPPHRTQAFVTYSPSAIQFWLCLLNFHIFGRLKTHLWSQWFPRGKTIRA